MRLQTSRSRSCRVKRRFPQLPGPPLGSGEAAPAAAGGKTAGGQGLTERGSAMEGRRGPVSTPRGP